MNETEPQQQHPSAEKVAKEFVRQYYTLLTKAPKYVHRFYTKDSVLKYNDVPMTFGQNDIKKVIHDQSFENCIATISHTEVQHTLRNGVVVQVTGSLSNNGNPARRFKDTFVLEALSAKQYGIRNHIFRYIDTVVLSKNKDSGTCCGEEEIPQQAGVANGENTMTTEQQTQQEQQLILARGSAAGNFTVPPPQLPQFSLQPVAEQPTWGVDEELLPKIQPIEAATVDDPPTIVTPPQVATDMPQTSGQLPQPSTGDSNAEPLPLMTNDSTLGTKKKKEPPSRGQKSNDKKPLLLTPSTSRQALFNNASISISHTQPGRIRIEGFGTILESQEEESEATKQQEHERKSYANLFKSNSPPPFMNAGNQQQKQPPLRPKLTGSQNNNTGNFPPFLMSGRGAFNNNFTIRIEPNNVASGTQPRKMNNNSGPFRDSQQLFLGNIPHHATEDELKLIFQRFGKIVQLRVLSKQGSKSSHGQRGPLNYGFLTYESESSVQACLAGCPIFFPENSLDRQKLNVEVKKPRNRSNDLQRNRSQAQSLGSAHTNSARQSNAGGNRMRRNNSTGGLFNRIDNRTVGQKGRGSGNFSARC